VTTTTNTPVTSLDPLFAQMGAATIQHAWAIPELTDREKVFLTITADVCQGTLGRPFELHVRSGSGHSVSTADIRDLLRFVSYDTGYHAALAALDRLAEIESADGLPGPDVELLAAEQVDTGPDAAPSPLPAAVRAKLQEMDPHFTEFFDLQSRMRAGAGTLSVRERAFTTMSVDVHYQTLDETFRIHISRALGAGASHDDVRAALRFTAQFGATRAWQAWRAFNAHLADLT
jgi:alkylhydroperoxidase/carboxymuconolactone decarboxylase family protein YurZ